MSTLIEGRPMAWSSIRVKCSCGRDLRARPDLAGSEITCWSCHATVPVPVPVAPGGWVARLLRMGARQILEARTFTLLATGAVLVTAGLSVTRLGVALGPRLGILMPYPGVWAAALALALVMVGYGELLRRGSQGDWVPRPHVGPLVLAWRAFLCLGAGIALVLPLIVASAGQPPPRLTPIGLAIALGATLLYPLVMLGTYFPRGTITERVRMIASIVKRHPVAVLASLLILPLSLPAIEAVLFVVMRISSTFTFMLLDLFPMHRSIRIYMDIPYYAPSEFRMTWVDYRELGGTTLLGLYGESLWQGYTLVGAIPASLAMETSNHFYLESIGLNARSYVAYRMFFTLVIATGMLSVLAVQARWLGLLSTMDTRRSAASPGSTGLFQLPNLTPEKR